MKNLKLTGSIIYDGLISHAASKINAALSRVSGKSIDIVFGSPEFNDSGSVANTAYITVLWNGVIVQNKMELHGSIDYIGIPEYDACVDGAQLFLQNYNLTVS